MPIPNPTLLNAGSNTNADSVYTTGVIAPVADSLLILIMSWCAASAATTKPINVSSQTISPALTWVKQASAEAVTASRSANSAIWTAIVPSSAPSSGTVTVTGSASCNRKAGQVLQVLNNFDPVSLIRQFKEEQSAAANPYGFTWGSTPLASGLCIAAISGRNTTAIVAPSDYTSLDGTSAGSNSDSDVSYKIGADGDVFWTGTSTDTTLGPSAAVGIEINELADTFVPPSVVLSQRNSAIYRI